ncbi:hypothetical protein OFC62_29520, partial [Escherichia coli]|nr:hypothetical protein [Escherichia coli]
SLAHRRTVRGGIPMVRATVALVAPSCSSSLSAWAFCSVVYFFMVPAPVGFSPVLKRHALKMAGVFGGYTAFVRAWSCGWVFLWLRRLEWLWCVLVKGALPRPCKWFVMA